MNKQTVEVEVSIPDGYDLVRYGKPEKGEYYINKHDILDMALFDHYNSYFIVKKQWNGLDFLNDFWIAKDYRGGSYCYMSKPELSGAVWNAFGSGCLRLDLINEFLKEKIEDPFVNKKGGQKCIMHIKNRSE
jgi:hypothetical protein